MEDLNLQCIILKMKGTYQVENERCFWAVFDGRSRASTPHRTSVWAYFGIREREADRLLRVVASSCPVHSRASRAGSQVGPRIARPDPA